MIWLLDQANRPLAGLKDLLDAYLERGQGRRPMFISLPGYLQARKGVPRYGRPRRAGHGLDLTISRDLIPTGVKGVYLIKNFSRYVERLLIRTDIQTV